MRSALSGQHTAELAAERQERDQAEAQLLMLKESTAKMEIEQKNKIEAQMSEVSGIHVYPCVLRIKESKVTFQQNILIMDIGSAGSDTLFEKLSEKIMLSWGLHHLTWPKNHLQ